MAGKKKTANMGAGADERNAKERPAKAEPSHGARLDALEKAHRKLLDLAERNGWSV